MSGMHAPGEKPLYWIGSARKDLLAFPEEVVDDFGYELGVVQQGGAPSSAKPWKSLRPECAQPEPILS